LTFEKLVQLVPRLFMGTNFRLLYRLFIELVAELPIRHSLTKPGIELYWHFAKKLEHQVLLTAW
jgi:hypothetical protein